MWGRGLPLPGLTWLLAGVSWLPPGRSLHHPKVTSSHRWHAGRWSCIWAKLYGIFSLPKFHRVCQNSKALPPMSPMWWCHSLVMSTCQGLYSWDICGQTEITIWGKTSHLLASWLLAGKQNQGPQWGPAFLLGMDPMDNMNLSGAQCHSPLSLSFKFYCIVFKVIP